MFFTLLSPSLITLTVQTVGRGNSYNCFLVAFFSWEQPLVYSQVSVLCPGSSLGQMFPLVSTLPEAGQLWHFRGAGLYLTHKCRRYIRHKLLLQAPRLVCGVILGPAAEVLLHPLLLFSASRQWYLVRALICLPCNNLAIAAVPSRNINWHHSLPIAATSCLFLKAKPETECWSKSLCGGSCIAEQVVHTCCKVCFACWFAKKSSMLMLKRLKPIKLEVVCELLPVEGTFLFPTFCHCWN